MKDSPDLCQNCVHYDYDEEYMENVCNIAVDEDEIGRYYSHSKYRCPYFRYYNEYDTVKKQI